MSEKISTEDYRPEFVKLYVPNGSEEEGWAERIRMEKDGFKLRWILERPTGTYFYYERTRK